jgi:hypothetical protein
MRRQDVEEQFGKLFSLTGRKLPDTSRPKDYLSKLQKYELEDFVAACGDDDALEEISRFGFNWPVLKRHIERMKGIRLKNEPENIDEKKRFNTSRMPDSIKDQIKKIKGFAD